MTMTTVSAKEVQKRVTAILTFSKMPLDTRNDLKRILHMAELAVTQDTLLYVTFEELVILGLAKDFILGDDYTSTVP